MTVTNRIRTIAIMASTRIENSVLVKFKIRGLAVAPMVKSQLLVFEGEMVYPAKQEQA